jgi:murein DD-endopeptidase MepM/ murein hydrolase activator NlpD
MRPPVKGRISSRFGKRIHPISHKESFHNGVDIAVPVGTDIVAPENGKITEVWDHARGGLCIAMASTTGTRYGFAHLSKRMRKVGDRVFEGEAFAETGNSGSSTGPHVHFTVKKASSWVNPEDYFKFM